MNISQRENKYASKRGHQLNDSISEFSQQKTGPSQSFKIIQKNFDDYKKNCEQLTQMTADVIKQRFQNAEPLEGDTKNYDSYSCVICTLLAYEPVICSKCEMAVLCQSCKDGWQLQKRGNFECPNCKSQNSIRKLGRKENEARDNIQVICSACPKENNKMPLSKYVSHKCNVFKPCQCPQNCGATINSLNEIYEHYLKCQNSIVICLCCHSQVKKSQINDQVFSQIKKYFDEQKYRNKKEQISIRSCHLQQSDRAYLKQSIDFNEIQMSELKQQYSNQKINFDPVLSEDQQEKSNNEKMKEYSDMIENLTVTNQELNEQKHRYWEKSQKNKSKYQCSLSLNILLLVAIITLAIFLSKSIKAAQNQAQEPVQPTQNLSLMQIQMQSILDSTNNFTKAQKTIFNQIGPIQISKVNGKYQDFNVSFSADEYIIKNLSNIQFVGVGINQNNFSYTGMVNITSNKPHGFGRLQNNNDFNVFEGQFLNGQFHGYQRQIQQNGGYVEQVYENDVFIQYLSFHI